MSEVAGKIAAQAGAFMLERPLGGRGVLLGGVPGVTGGVVVVIGGGVVGFNAALIASTSPAPPPPSKALTFIGGADHRATLG